jgi:hypothetical protein
MKLLTIICLASVIGCATTLPKGITATREVVCINNESECWVSAAAECGGKFILIGRTSRVEGRAGATGDLRIVDTVICSRPLGAQ